MNLSFLFIVFGANPIICGTPGIRIFPACWCTKTGGEIADTAGSAKTGGYMRKKVRKL